MSKKQSVKVKRPRVDWKKTLFESEDLEVQNYYWFLKVRAHHAGRKISDNRLARAALLHYYSYQKLERVRWLGEKL